MRKTIIAIALILTASVAFSQAKPAAKDSAVYYLLGQVKDYQLLYAALTQPGDVTPNQIKALVEWITKAQPLPPKEEKKTEPIKDPVKK